MIYHSSFSIMNKWKQAVIKARNPVYYEDEEAYVIIDRLLSACDAHLGCTSLEYLASSSERPSLSNLPPNLTLDETDIHLKDEKRLRELFLRDFVLHNQPQIGLTKNELLFLALAKAHYTLRARTFKWAEKEPRLRVDTPACVFGPLMDARTKLAETMSVHGHIVHGVPYETRQSKQRRRKECRMDRLCPTDHTLVEWQELRKAQEDEEAREANEEVERARRVQQALRLRKRRVEEEEGQLYPSDEDDDYRDEAQHGDPDRIIGEGVEWKPQAAFPNVDSAMDEVSFFLTCYYVAGVEALADEMGSVPEEELVLSEERKKERDLLTNGSQGGNLGDMWRHEFNPSDPRNYARSYLVMATQFFAQAWCEERWWATFPMRVVKVPVALQRGFAGYVAGRLDQSIQDSHLKEFHANCFEWLLPIGGRGLATRLTGVKGGQPRKRMYQMHGVSVVSEIDEMVDSEAGVRLVGYDPLHPLFDAQAMMWVQSTCYGQNASLFSMIARCTLPTDQLLRMGKALEEKGVSRRPWIVRLCGVWLVHDKDQGWVRPNKEGFASAWLVFLCLLKEKHRFQMDDLNDLSYWEAKLRVKLPQLKP